MAELRPPPAAPIADVEELCETTRRRIAAWTRTNEPLLAFSEPPFVAFAPLTFVLRCDLAAMVLGVAAVIAVFFSLVTALALAALAALAFVLRWIVQLGLVLPARRRLAQCEVRPAVVVQCYTHGFDPPEPHETSQRFTGVVVFSFDPSVTIAHLRQLASRCFAAKSGPDSGPLAELTRMLRRGDTEFVREAFRLPADLAGNDCTWASTILFQRDVDLIDGYLSTVAQLVLAHPRKPEHVCPVPLVFHDAKQSRELLGVR